MLGPLLALGFLMLVEDLFTQPPGGSFGSAPEVDPLTETDALQEAQLLDIRVCALTSMVGLLFDLRMALQLRAANTAVLVGRGVQECSWSAERRVTARTAWNVVGSEPARDHPFSHSVLLSFFPNAQLRLVSELAEGEVPGLDPTPPDYVVDDEARIQASLAGWTSTFKPVQAVFRRA